MLESQPINEKFDALDSEEYDIEENNSIVERITAYHNIPLVALLIFMLFVILFKFSLKKVCDRIIKLCTSESSKTVTLPIYYETLDPYTHRKLQDSYKMRIEELELLGEKKPVKLI